MAQTSPTPRRLYPIIVGPLLVVLFFVALSLRVELLDGAPHKQPDAFEKQKSPGPWVLHALSLNHELAFADMVWLEIVQQIGSAEGKLSQQWMDRLEYLANVGTDLDSKYFIIYHSVAIYLSAYASNVEASDRMVERGMQALPGHYEFPFLKGYNAYFIRGDAKEASEQWLRASQLPRSPPYLAPLAARTRFNAGDTKNAIGLLQRLLQVTKDPQVRDLLKLRLQAIETEAVLEAYDQVCEKYLSENEGKILSPMEFFEKGYIALPAKDHLGETFTNSVEEGKCITRAPSITRRRFEAAKDIGSGGVKLN